MDGGKLADCGVRSRHVALLRQCARAALNNQEPPRIRSNSQAVRACGAVIWYVREKEILSDMVEDASEGFYWSFYWSKDRTGGRVSADGMQFAITGRDGFGENRVSGMRRLSLFRVEPSLERAVTGRSRKERGVRWQELQPNWCGRSADLLVPIRMTHGIVSAFV